MPKNVRFSRLKKVLIVTKDSHVRSISKYMLKDMFNCLHFGSAPDAHFTLKTSTRVKVLILDWSIQDKYDSLFKCLIEAKKRGDIYVINLFTSAEQKMTLKKKRPDIKKNKMMYFISIEFQSVSLILNLIKLKKELMVRS